MLDELARGGTTAQIAERLTVSPHTVQAHVRSVLAKMGVESRLMAVVVAYRLGLVDRPG